VRGVVARSTAEVCGHSANWSALLEGKDLWDDEPLPAGESANTDLAEIGKHVICMSKKVSNGGPLYFSS